MGIKRRTHGHTQYGLRGRASGGDPAGLMLVHVTAVGAAREILHAGQMIVKRCKVFKRDLIYFFVLRPAYRPKDSREKRTLMDFFPFVFVLDPTLMGAPHHVYPFDTGGAFDGAFDPVSSPWLPLEDYELEETLQGAVDFMAWAFDSPADYYDGKLKPGLAETLPAWDSHGLSFAEIARLSAVGSNMADLRASSIEVAYTAHIPLSPHVKFVVMPRQFLEDPLGRNQAMFDALAASGITDWETYDWRPNRPPEDFHVEINAIVRTWLAKQGAI